MIVTLAVENYRSLRRLIVPLAPLTVVTGGNGTGKSSLYRALRLLADAARNGAVAALAREGGLPSTLWAGPETTGWAVREGVHPVQGAVRGKSVALRLGFGGDEFSYAIDFGFPAGGGFGAFKLDPEIKRECIWNGLLRPAAVLCERAGQRLRRDPGGRARAARRAGLALAGAHADRRTPRPGPLTVSRERRAADSGPLTRARHRR